MIDLRPILLVNGMLLAFLGVAMLIPAIADLTVNNDDWKVFLVSSGATMFLGISLVLTNWGHGGNLTVQQAFLLTTASWVFCTAFGALPFVFSDLNLSYTDAFFESMSGLTTTGSTVIAGLDEAPPGLLLWRALLQWLGGIGIIVMAIAILPMLQVGGMQLFRLESSDTSEKILPRATQISGSIALIYVMLTVFCAFAYWVADMPAFDAVAHAMTTIATGGFSTSDDSVGAFSNGLVDYTAVTFMILGSLPFMLYFQLIFRLKLGPILRDSQVRWFFGIVLSLILVMTIYRIWTGEDEAGMAFRHAAFNVTSILTGTGYATTDYHNWGSFAVVTFFCIMFIGGCAGSTSCGIKIFRFQIMSKAVWRLTKRSIHPHGVFTSRYNGRPLSPDVTWSVMSFVFVFYACFAIMAAALAALGLDTLTALSAAGTAIANVGPGLGEAIGPDGTFRGLPDTAKWILCFGMLLGRLEVFTVLVLFAPSFWRA